MKIMNKTTSKILSVLLLLIASASWTGAKADNFFEGKAFATYVDGIYYYINENNQAIVTNKEMSSVGSIKPDYINAYSGSVVIPASIEIGLETYPVVAIQDYAFYGCTNLSNVHIPKSVETIGENSFSESPLLVRINVANESPYFFSDDGVLLDKDKTEVIRFPEGKEGAYDAPASVTSIANKAFSSCVGLTSVTLPDGLLSIGTKAFYECSALTSVNIPESVTSIGGNAFAYCQELKSTITIPSGVMAINEYTFTECSNLTTVNLQEGLTSIDKYAFSKCTSLKKINLPESLTSIDVYAFSNTGLTSVTLPSQITTIKAGTFSACNLTSITLPENLKEILAKAFSNNGATISTLDIPANVNSIANNAFDGTTIKNIYINNIPRNIKIGATKPFHKVDGMKIHVFDKLANDFKNAENWNEYADYIVDDINIKHITAVALDRTTLKMGYIATYKLNAAIQPANATVKEVTFTSSNPNIVAITNVATGEIAACGVEGEATITCTAADGSGTFATCKVTVKNDFIPASDITLNKTNVNMNVGSTLKLKATIAPANATYPTATWKSSDESVATVDANSGLVTAIAPGNVTITARSTDGYVSTTCEILVSYATYVIDDTGKTDGSADYKNEVQAHVNTLTYKRKFGTTNWQAFYVPFRMSYNDWKNDVVIAKIVNFHTYDKNNDGINEYKELEIEIVKSGTILENHPYLIKAIETGEKEITVNDATLYANDENSINCASIEESYKFTGTYSSIDGLLDKGYNVVSAGAIKTVGNNTTKLAPYRWYLEITDREGQVIKTPSNAKIVVVGEFENETTGIEESALSGSNNVSETIYSVNGVKVNKLQKGLNIVKMANGSIKKIIVR